MNLKQIISADKHDYKAMMSAATLAIDYAINIGERLMLAKPQVDDFGEWLQATHPFQVKQANKYIRVAVHKGQALQLIADGRAASINDLQTLLPKASETPETTEADSNNLGYTGTKPGSRDASVSDDWHTPAEFTAAATKVMGNIDLDPFSSVKANKHVGATRLFNKADNALDRSWASKATRTVWMNPPYSAGLSGKAVDKFLEEFDYGSFTEAIVLMNSSTDTQWFDKMIHVANAVCFTVGRISFIDGGGKKASSNTKGQVFFYFGNKGKTFKKVFSEYGNVLFTENV